VVGDYSFDRPLAIGDKLVFLDMAHYTMVKDHHVQRRAAARRFANPRPGGPRKITVHRRFGYRDYRDRLS